MFRDKTNLLLSSFQTFWKYERTTFIYFSFLSGALFILLDLLIYSKFQGDTLLSSNPRDHISFYGKLSIYNI